MKIGVPREIKSQSQRVAIALGRARFVRNGHVVVIESGEGEGSSIPRPRVHCSQTVIVLCARCRAWASAILKVKGIEASTRCCARGRSCSPTSTWPPHGPAPMP